MQHLSLMRHLNKMQLFVTSVLVVFFCKNTLKAYVTQFFLFLRNLTSIKEAILPWTTWRKIVIPKCFLSKVDGTKPLLFECCLERNMM